jgi:hypothetical protein
MAPPRVQQQRYPSGRKANTLPRVPSIKTNSRTQSIRTGISPLQEHRPTQKSKPIGEGDLPVGHLSAAGALTKPESEMSQIIGMGRLEIESARLHIKIA